VNEENLAYWGERAFTPPPKKTSEKLYCVFWQKFANVLEEPVASIIGMGTLNVAAAGSAGVCGVASLSILA
jgi:hypothetical protein